MFYICINVDFLVIVFGYRIIGFICENIIDVYGSIYMIY